MAMLTPEGIARRIQTLYEDHYNTYLDAVEAEWVGTEDITLNDFAERRIVTNPGNLGVFSNYPALGISVGKMRKDEGGDQKVQLYDSFYLMDVRLGYFLRGIDDRQLSLMAVRHIQATLNFLNAHARLDYGNEVSIRNVEMEPSANLFSSGGNTLVKGLLVQFQVRFLQRGF